MAQDWHCCILITSLDSETHCNLAILSFQNHFWFKFPEIRDCAGVRRAPVGFSRGSSTTTPSPSSGWTRRLARSSGRSISLLYRVVKDATEIGEIAWSAYEHKVFSDFRRANRSTMRQPVRWAEPFDDASTSTVGRTVRRCVKGGPTWPTMCQPVRWADPVDDASSIFFVKIRCSSNERGQPRLNVWFSWIFLCFGFFAICKRSFT